MGDALGNALFAAVLLFFGSIAFLGLTAIVSGIVALVASGTARIFTGKKEIFLAADCPASTVAQAIRANIENKDGIFGKEPQKPLCGEEENGSFSLGLNDRYFFKFEPFERFSCEVLGDSEKCTMHLVFESPFVFAYIVMLIALAVYIVFAGKGEARFAAIVVAVIVVYRAFAFSIKINKCMDEIEYIIDKVQNEQRAQSVL